MINKDLLKNFDIELNSTRLIDFYHCEMFFHESLVAILIVRTSSIQFLFSKFFENSCDMDPWKLGLSIGYIYQLQTGTCHERLLMTRQQQQWYLLSAAICCLLQHGD